MIINDVSAISDEVAKMSEWFKFAPCDAGIDGVKNTLNKVQEGIKEVQKDFEKGLVNMKNTTP